jgi:hypothetical protein
MVKEARVLRERRLHKFFAHVVHNNSAVPEPSKDRARSTSEVSSQDTSLVLQALLLTRQCHRKTISSLSAPVSP